MEERFILGQQALTPDGAVYQIIMDTPYEPNTAPELVAQILLPTVTPKDAVAGSTCIYNTEDADGYPVEWLFAFDGTNWALDRVVRGGSAGGGGGGGTSFPTFTITGMNSWTCDMTYEEAKAVWDAEGLGGGTVANRKTCPCVTDTGLIRYWSEMKYVLRSDIVNETQPPMPSDIVGCLRAGDVYYGDDNKFYAITAS